MGDNSTYLIIICLVDNILIIEMIYRYVPSQLFGVHWQPLVESRVESNPCMELPVTEKYNMTQLNDKTRTPSYNSTD